MKDKLLIKSWIAVNAIRKAFLKLLKSTIFRYYIKIDVVGRENVPKSQCLLASNHTSVIDGLLVLIASGRCSSEMTTVAARDYFYNNRLRRVMISLFMEMTPIERNSKHKTGELSAVSALSSSILRTNKSLIIFPEGTRSVDGELKKFKSGIGYLASEFELPVVPVKITGIYNIFRKGMLLPRPGRVEIKFGEIISASDLSEFNYNYSGFAKYLYSLIKML